MDIYLDNTKSHIILIIPAPFPWYVPDGEFVDFTGFVDADDAAAYSDTLRLIYKTFENYHPRVSVFDTHESVFGGSRIDSINVAPLTEYTNNPQPKMENPVIK